MLTHRFDLSDYGRALATALGKRHSQAVKVAFTFSSKGLPSAWRPVTPTTWGSLSPTPLRPGSGPEKGSAA
jgi:hypothetical protein